MSRLRQVRLVATREFLERGRSKGFIFSLLLTQGLLIGVFVLRVFLAADASTLKIGTVGPAPANLGAALAAVADAYGLDVTLSAWPDVPAAEAAVREDKVAAVIVPPSVAAGASGAGELIVKDRPSGPIQAVVAGAYAVLAQPAPVPQPSLRSLDPTGATDEAALIFANLVVIFLFMSIVMYGQWVLTGVVEEKQSRVVEVVLAAVPARDLIMGKVIGIGILGILQLVIFGLTALVLARVTGEASLPATTPATVALMLVWFIIGYGLYAAALAAAGSLTSRMEEASNLTLPIITPAMISYFLALTVIADSPDGMVARIATFVPLSAPIVVPIRAALGAIEPWEIVVSAVLALAAIWGMFIVAGRVYMGAILSSGARVRLRDAWRSAGR